MPCVVYAMSPPAEATAPVASEAETQVVGHAERDGFVGLEIEARLMEAANFVAGAFVAGMVVAVVTMDAVVHSLSVGSAGAYRRQKEYSSTPGSERA